MGQTGNQRQQAVGDAHHSEADALDRLAPKLVDREGRDDIARQGRDQEDQQHLDHVRHLTGVGIERVQNQRIRGRRAVVGDIQQEPGPGSSDNPAQVAASGEQGEAGLVRLAFRRLRRHSARRHSFVLLTRHLRRRVRGPVEVAVHHQGKTRGFGNLAAQVEGSQRGDRAKGQHQAPGEVLAHARSQQHNRDQRTENQAQALHREDHRNQLAAILAV